MAERADAEAALYDAIIAAANSAAENKDGDLLKTAAESFREVAHGPSGGDYSLTRNAYDRSASTYDGRTSHTSDYHETHHPDGGPRPPVGFREERDGQASPKPQ